MAAVTEIIRASSSSDTNAIPVDEEAYHKFCRLLLVCVQVS